MNRVEQINEIICLMKDIRVALFKRHMHTKTPLLFPAQAAIVEMIENNPSISQVDIASRLNISRSAVTQSINSLVEQKIVERQNDIHDKKKFHLSLSNITKNMIKKFKRNNQCEMEQIFSSLTDEDVEKFLEIGKKIKSNI